MGRIVVAPDARGCAVGKVLCKQLVAAALETTSAATVTLRVYRDNVVVVRLYSSSGFVEVPSESNTEVVFMKLMADRSHDVGA
ncbi:GNAT family N-acetyltransferase [Noviherbaspirillum sp. 17J57-3]|uniref:GNAT family N-acetyltransferase n=1 Tax=Noviherbaspirillum galbum TaxID=2709383 RepID=A0A6B3SMZ2_9BURK|nr:GNAT family N-acetyltransferase [Noviherbaspirillum galbum]